MSVFVFVLFFIRRLNFRILRATNPNYNLFFFYSEQFSFIKSKYSKNNEL